MAPEYKEIDAHIRVHLRDGVTDAELWNLTDSYLSAKGVGIGEKVRPDELMARLQALPGVLRVSSVEFRTSAAGCYQNAGGEIHLPRIGIACLRSFRLERTSVEF